MKLLCLNYYLISLCLLLFSNDYVFGQKQQFRGVVNIKSYKIDNHISKSAAAKMMSKFNDLPITEFDTLYRKHYICNDTVIVYITGVDNLHWSKELEFESSTYLYDSKNYEFIKMPLMKRTFSGIKGSDWRKYKKKKEKDLFEYNYILIHPRHKTFTYFAEIDRSIKYPNQLATGGHHALIFHPYGRFNKLISRKDTTEHVNLYEYQSDPDLSCEEHFYDFKFRDIELDSNKLPGYYPDLTLIPESDRQQLLLEEVEPIKSTNTASLTEFKGKYVYIDLWASWCAPCKLEMPFLEKIEEKYADKGLAVLSISVDERKDDRKWRKAVADLNMNWTNWIIYGGLRSDMAKEYVKMGIPHYLLLDPQGRIINANAPRPSDGRLEELLDQIFE